MKVSVVIPMYNVGRMLERSVDSLYKQTLQNLELLFVDDCSKDNTLSVLDELLKQYNRPDIEVRIIKQQKNGGVASARNAALDMASGEYIYHADADDYIEPETLEVLYNKASSDNLDIVGCEWFLSFEQNERYMTQPDVKTGEEMFKKMCKGCMRWNLWMFLIKKTVYDRYSLRFIPQMNMGEDMMLVMKAALHTGNVAIIHKPLYHYIQTNNNSLTKYFSDSRGQVTANVNELEKYIKEIGRTDLSDYIRLLELTVKHPLLISSRTEDYKLWYAWFTAANDYIEKNDDATLYTKLIQKAARAKQYWFLKLYYVCVIKILYGLIYR